MGKAKKKSLSKRRESRFKKKRVHIPDQIRATLIDLVVNRGLSLAEAGQRVQPRLSKSTVSTIISNFRKTNRYSAEISQKFLDKSFLIQCKLYTNMILRNFIRVGQPERLRPVEDHASSQMIKNKPLWRWFAKRMTCDFRKFNK